MRNEQFEKTKRLAKDLRNIRRAIQEYDNRHVYNACDCSCLCRFGKPEAP